LLGAHMTDKVATPLILAFVYTRLAKTMSASIVDITADDYRGQEHPWIIGDTSFTITSISAPIIMYVVKPALAYPAGSDARDRT
jgi:hypothetical protein